MTEPDSGPQITVDAPTPARRQRDGRGRIPSWNRPPRWVTIVAFVVVGLLLVAATAALWLGPKLDPSGPPGEVVTVEVPDGATTTDIAELLAAADVVADAQVFRLYTRFTGAGGFQAGTYELPVNSAVWDVVDLLDDGPVITYERFSFPEGFTVAQILERVEGAERLDLEAFRAAMAASTSSFSPGSFHPAVTADQRLEGLLFPDTYFLDDTEDEADLVARMIALADRTATELGYEQAAERVGLTPYETFIVASLIEREARVPEDRRKISRVIHNRLERGQRLEIDATVLYALGGHKERVLYSDLEVDSPWNTYRVTGLPPTPIASPGRAALAAAIDPEPGPWLYYVVIEASGRHAFAETFAQHQANIRQAERNGVR